MNSPAIPHLLVDRAIVDADLFGRQAGWEFEFRQLDAGSLEAHEAIMGTADSFAMRGEFSRKFHQAGQPPPRMFTFGIPDAGVGQFRWCGRDARGGDLLNFNLKNGFEGVTGGGFAGFIVSFDEEFLENVIEILKLDIDVVRQTSGCSLWTDAGAATNRLRQRLIAAFRASQICDCPDAAELFDCSAAALILQLISGATMHSPRTAPSQRRMAVRRALDQLEQHDKLPLTVSELCRQTGVSAPTLYRGFQEEFGIGPKRYLQIRRLAGVRKDLISSGGRLRVTDIANRWGFWHMGQFAADYRQHFGELPSATIRGARSVPAMFGDRS